MQMQTCFGPERVAHQNIERSSQSHPMPLEKLKDQLCGVFEVPRPPYSLPYKILSFHNIASKGQKTYGVSAVFAWILSRANFADSLQSPTARFHFPSCTAVLTDSSNLAFFFRLKVEPNNSRNLSCNSNPGTRASMGLCPPSRSDDSVWFDILREMRGR